MSDSTSSVRRWDAFSLTIAGPANDGMYLDETLRATFTQANRRVQVRGFYDGEGRFEVRFMPDSLGTWEYRLTASFIKSDMTGRFECVDPDEKNHGPVRARGRRLEYADGTEYHSFGTTCYAWVHQPMALQEQTLQTLRLSPFNKLRMCVFPKHYLFNENEPLYPVAGVTPEGALDFDRFNPEYFALLDKRIRELAELGIQADLILFHGYDRWGYATMTRRQDDRYIQYVVARYAAFHNVWWSLANEYDLMAEKRMEDWDRFFRIIQTEDPSQHLRSIHNCREFYDHGKPWVTHCSIQHQHTDRVPEWLDLYGKPVVIDECRYEGNIHKGWGNITPQEMTHRFWESTCHGGYAGHGETYVHPEDVLWWAKGGTLHGQSAARIAFLRSVVDGAPSGSWAPLSSGNEWSCIGIDGEYMLIYFGRSQPTYWPVTLPHEQRYVIDVIDAWEMTVTRLQEEFSGEARIPLPGKPYNAIRVRKES